MMIKINILNGLKNIYSYKKIWEWRYEDMLTCVRLESHSRVKVTERSFTNLNHVWSVQIFWARRWTGKLLRGFARSRTVVGKNLQRSTAVPSVRDAVGAWRGLEEVKKINKMKIYGVKLISDRGKAEQWQSGRMAEWRNVNIRLLYDILIYRLDMGVICENGVSQSYQFAVWSIKSWLNVWPY